MKLIHKLIKDTILKAVNAETECFISFKNDSVKVLSYRWATELHSILKLQTKNGAERDILIVEHYHIHLNDDKKEFIEQESIAIEWEKVRDATINEHGDRILIDIDGLEINFLEPIK